MQAGAGQAFGSGLDQVVIDVDAGYLAVPESAGEQGATVARPSAHVQHAGIIGDAGVTVHRYHQAGLGGRRGRPPVWVVTRLGVVGVRGAEAGDQCLIVVGRVQPPLLVGSPVADRPPVRAGPAPPVWDEDMPGDGGD